MCDQGNTPQIFEIEPSSKVIGVAGVAVIFIGLLAYAFFLWWIFLGSFNPYHAMVMSVVIALVLIVGMIMVGQWFVQWLRT